MQAVVAAVMIALAAVMTGGVVGGCSAWSFADDVEARKAEAAAARGRADEALKDIVAVEQATAAAASTDPVTGEPVTDQAKLAAGIATSGRPSVVDAVTEGVTAGQTVSQAAAAARAVAQQSHADALASLRAAQAAQREAEAKLAAASAKDNRAWDIGQLGVDALTAAIGLPIGGLIGAYFGRLRGIVTGATQTAQSIGTLRALDNDVDFALTATPAAAQMKAALNGVHPLVRRAISDNKTTPLPGTESAIALAAGREHSSGEVSSVEQRLREIDAELAVLRDGVASGKSAGAAGSA